MLRPVLRYSLIAVLASIVFLAGSGETKAWSKSFAEEQAFTLIAEEVYPAVVSITTTQIYKLRYRTYGRYFGQDEYFDNFFQEFFGPVPEREYKQIGVGSGVIIDQRGYILTNYHVVEGADNDEVLVKLPDGRELEGKIQGVDSRNDLAIVKIAGENLPTAKLGNSDEVKVGQWAVAIGNPFAFVMNDPRPTMTVGVISALHRSLPQLKKGDRYYFDLIQTDAAINRGNSGGPLVNVKGEVIGINVAIFSTTGGYQGIGFAIPVNTAKEVIDDLVKGKEIVYGWLGVNIQDITPDLADYFGLVDSSGVLVVKVLADSPASRAGIREKDIIRSFNGNIIEDSRQLIALVGRTQPNQRVDVTIIRETQESNLVVTIGERPGSLAGKGSVGPTGTVVGSWRGLKVSEITTDLARQLDLSEASGVVVTDIEIDSEADKSGIQKGDVITQINRRQIRSLTDYNSMTSNIRRDALVKTSRGYFIIKGGS